MDDDPEAFEKKIDAATDHGIDLFVFDWYWYDGEPFLESTLNNGFLKARNNDRMQFYIMWAKHDVRGGIWNGEVTWDNYRVMVDRIIRQYFSQPNYFRIDGKPVFSIFSFRDLFNSFETLEGTKQALDYFRKETENAGIPGLHVQVITRNVMGNPGFCSSMPGMSGWKVLILNRT